MSTRHLSAQVDYPFVPTLNVSDSQIVGGILDLYFIVQGVPDSEPYWFAEGLNQSSASDETPSPPTIHLTDYTDYGTYTEFVFSAEYGPQQWLFIFDVPNNGNASPDQTGQVTNKNTSDGSAVLIFKSTDIVRASGSCSIKVEPCRSQWHTEFINTVSFYNKHSCIDSLEFVSSAEAIHDENSFLQLSDGYNTVIYFDDDTLYINGGIGLGKGHTDLGIEYSDPCESSLAAEEESYVYTINGLVSQSGDIPITTSNSLGISRSTGNLTITAKR